MIVDVSWVKRLERLIQKNLNIIVGAFNRYIEGKVSGNKHMRLYFVTLKISIFYFNI